MAAARLTPNGVRAMLDGDTNLKPVVQIIDLRGVNVSGAGASRGERYRAVVSDGAVSSSALFATQLSDVARSGVLRTGAIVQLLEYVINDVGLRRIIVILNMEVLVSECEIIGNPVMPSETGVPNPNSTRVEQLNGAPQYGSMSGNSNFTRPSNNAPVVQRSMAGNQLNTAIRPTDKVPAFQPTVQPSYSPVPSYKNHGPIVKNEAPARIIPISALNPYQGRWALKARVTAKADIKRYHNAKGDGKLFSFDLLDSDGGEIRAVCFGDSVDRFYEVVEVGKVYVVSRGSLKPKQKKFNHLKNEWEIHLEAGSIVELSPDESNSIPSQRFNFKPINEIEDTPVGDVIDVVGVVISVNPCTIILKKNGMETQKRTINLKDMSGGSVEVTMWGEFCNREGSQLQEMVECGIFPVLVIKAGLVNYFNGKCVGTIASTQLFINPDLDEAHNLRQWFDGGGRDASTRSISRDTASAASRNEIRKTIAQIKEEGLGMGDKPDWVTVKATVIFFKSDSFCYTACPNMIGDRQCSKKVTKSSSGNWCCDKCDREFPECDYRYILQLQIQDHSGTTWATAFQESGQELLGCSARELHMLRENEDPRFSEIMLSCLFQDYLLRLKVKEETYGDDRRVKNTLVKVEGVDPSRESKYLLDLISKSGALY